MTKVTGASEIIGVSPSQIRKWTKTYARFLSEEATPSPGQQRLYNQDDLLVLSTIATMRQQLTEYSAIEEALEEGKRIEPVMPFSTQAPKKKGSEDATESYTTTLALFDKRLTVASGKVDSLQEQLLESEKARVAAETELKILKEQVTEAKEQANKSWWSRLFS